MDRDITSEQIRKSASLLKQARPAYKDLIDFYEALYLAQEESRIQINLDPILIEPEELKIKLDSGMPLIDASLFLIDPKHAKRLLATLCTIAEEKAPNLASDAKKIITVLSNDSSQIENLFNSLLKSDHKLFKSTAQLYDLHEKSTALLAFEAMAPSIHACAAQLEYYLKPQSSHPKGYCPVCGNPPQMAFLHQDGEKHLVCSFCLHTWKTSRMGCALCQNREKEKQHYFYNEEEREYRVDLCDNCGKYIKLIDLRELTRAFYPPLEQLCTIHLDMQATEQGYAGVVQGDLSRP